MSEVLVYPTHAAASRALCDRLARVSEIAMAVRDRFVIALAGGSTPKMAYDLLSSEYAPQMDWESSYVFWADERCVPPESTHSNARMARESLLNHVRIPVNHIYRIKGENPPEQAAREYDALLHDFFSSRGERRPRFDAVLLGLGTDGHIASLLPGSAAVHEQTRWVTTAQRPEEPYGRVTLTVPAINSAANILYLVTGADKAAIMARVLKGDTRQGALPAQLIKPAQGNMIWVLDEAAAHDL